MCGICGICLDDPRARVDSAVLDAMSSSLAHRGPDGNGTFLDGPVGLGHRRLSIIDLSRGEQPMYNEDRTIALIFNGEIYNYIELRKSLIERGHRFCSDADTEVLVHLYEDYGDQCVEHLRGMFAFAIWDGRRKRLLAARDRMGEKPFYYCQHNGRFLFASELKALHKDRTWTPRICTASLDHYLAYGYIPAPFTIFEDVFKLQAAHTLVWEKGRVSTSPYWKVDFTTGPRLDEQEYVEELRRRLDDSIRLQMRSDVPLGAFLSGGIDSSAIVALASLQMNKPLATFSVAFADQEFDESRYARMVAERYGTEHHEIVVRDMDVSTFPDLVGHFDEPFADPSAIPTYYITREARRFVKVCLSGDGGDELFGGYDQYEDCLRQRWVDWIPGGVRRAMFGRLSSALPDYVYGKGWLRRMSVSGAVRYQRQMGVFDPEERFQLLRSEHFDPSTQEPWLFSPYFSDNGHDPVAVRQHTDQRTYLPEDILVKVDRTSMMHALEVRVPFLDHRVVEWTNAMPTNMKIRGGVRKYVLKRLLADLLPAEILERGKRGFGIPIKHWFRSDLDGFARDMLLSPSSRSQQFFRPDAVRRLLDGHGRGLRDLSRRLWTVLWFEQWCRLSGV
ncbi:MAG: asparagine synthase (glutamine-hydrolyzing) [Planctomycetes bacterium]|nr:asparagine synthase (glutamine-hydrolyzing) [Planctomycetota bacterium]